MSRITDALKRARTGMVADPGAGDDRTGNPIQFFAPGQPAVVPPWGVGIEPTGQPSAPDRPQPGRARRDDPSSMLLLRRAPPVAEGIRFPPRANVEKLVVSRAIEPLAREQYKKLAAALHQAQLERPVKVVMLTSALPGEGKTLTAANLALTLAESYRRHVLLVDADLRRPMIHEVFGVSNARGLNDSLADEGPLPLIQASPRLSLLTAGPGGGDPMATLTSERMRALIEEARAAFDWVLLDTPPVALLSDAKLLASMTDGAVLVALAGKTAYDVIQPAIEVFGQDRVVGVVLNRATAAALPYPYQRYYDDYYDPPVR